MPSQVPHSVKSVITFRVTTRTHVSLCSPVPPSRNLTITRQLLAYRYCRWCSLLVPQSTTTPLILQATPLFWEKQLARSTKIGWDAYGHSSYGWRDWRIILRSGERGWRDYGISSSPLSLSLAICNSTWKPIAIDFAEARASGEKTRGVKSSHNRFGLPWIGHLKATGLNYVHLEILAVMPGSHAGDFESRREARITLTGTWPTSLLWNHHLHSMFSISFAMRTSSRDMTIHLYVTVLECMPLSQLPLKIDLEKILVITGAYIK